MPYCGLIDKKKEPRAGDVLELYVGRPLRFLVGAEHATSKTFCEVPQTFACRFLVGGLFAALASDEIDDTHVESSVCMTDNFTILPRLV